MGCVFVYFSPPGLMSYGDWETQNISLTRFYGEICSFFFFFFWTMHQFRVSGAAKNRLGAKTITSCLIQFFWWFKLFIKPVSEEPFAQSSSELLDWSCTVNNNLHIARVSKETEQSTSHNFHSCCIFRSQLRYTHYLTVRSILNYKKLNKLILTNKEYTVTVLAAPDEKMVATPWACSSVLWDCFAHTQMARFKAKLIWVNQIKINLIDDAVYTFYVRLIKY